MVVDMEVMVEVNKRNFIFLILFHNTIPEIDFVSQSGWGGYGGYGR